MKIDPKLLKAIQESGFTCKEMADGIRKVFNSLPTAKELAERFTSNLRRGMKK